MFMFKWDAVGSSSQFERPSGAEVVPGTFFEGPGATDAGSNGPTPKWGRTGLERPASSARARASGFERSISKAPAKPSKLQRPIRKFWRPIGLAFGKFGRCGIFERRPAEVRLRAGQSHRKHRMVI